MSVSRNATEMNNNLGLNERIHARGLKILQYLQP